MGKIVQINGIELECSSGQLELRQRQTQQRLAMSYDDADAVMKAIDAALCGRRPSTRWAGYLKSEGHEDLM